MDRKARTLRLTDEQDEALREMSEETGINFTALVLAILWQKILGRRKQEK